MNGSHSLFKCISKEAFLNVDKMKWCVALGGVNGANAPRCQGSALPTSWAGAATAWFL